MILRATLTPPQIEFSAGYLLNIVEGLGTTISPYLFFWQASQEVEEKIMNGQVPDAGIGKNCITRQVIAEMSWDTVGGMFLSQLIMLFIIVTTATTLHNPWDNINTDRLTGCRGFETASLRLCLSALRNWNY